MAYFKVMYINFPVWAEEYKEPLSPQLAFEPEIETVAYHIESQLLYLQQRATTPEYQRIRLNMQFFYLPQKGFF